MEVFECLVTDLRVGRFDRRAVGDSSVLVPFGLREVSEKEFGVWFAVDVEGRTLVSVLSCRHSLGFRAGLLPDYPIVLVVLEKPFSEHYVRGVGNGEEE